MNAKLTLLAALFLLLIHLSYQCISNPYKGDFNPMKIKSSCYLSGNLYSNLLEREVHQNGSVFRRQFEYLTELCTYTHRIVILKPKKDDLSRSFIDGILFDVIPLVNYQLNLFKDIKLSKRNYRRLRRCLLEDAFYKSFKKHEPESSFYMVERPIIYHGCKLVQILDSLSDLYDKAFIEYYIFEADGGSSFITMNQV